MATNILVIDYGFGNLHSVQKAMGFIGTEVTLTRDHEALHGADGVILPGVGAFGDAMKGLEQLGFVQALRRYVECGKPLLGICLGMQLLFSSSEEFGFHTGLDIIHGRVIHFPQQEIIHDGFNYKIPHIGWNCLLKPAKETCWERTFLENIPKETEVYFVHSFVGVPKDSSQILAYTEYGGVLVAAVVKKGHVYGCQFHPEKSRGTGIQMLRNFVKIVEAVR